MIVRHSYCGQKIKVDKLPELCPYCGNPGSYDFVSYGSPEEPDPDPDQDPEIDQDPDQDPDQED